MKALRADSSATMRFVPSCDEGLPASEQTSFVTRNLTRREQYDLDNVSAKFAADGSVEMLGGLRRFAAISIGLVGIDNFFDSEGNPVSIKRDPAPSVLGRYCAIQESVLCLIPKEVLDEVADFILSSGKLDEEDEKN